MKKAISWTGFADARFVAAAPTFSQAKQIFWDDLKAMVPSSLVLGRISESNLSISLFNGTTIMVTGLDVPARVEGPPLAHIILDEYGNMKPDVWPEHVRPALSDTEALLISLEYQKDGIIIG